MAIRFVILLFLISDIRRLASELNAEVLSITKQSRSRCRRRKRFMGTVHFRFEMVDEVGVLAHRATNAAHRAGVAVTSEAF